MNKRLLVTRPNFDRTTRYVSVWAKDVIKVAEQKGFTVLDLVGKRANRREFEGMVRKHKPSFLFLNGHGSADAITGQNEEPLVEVGVNADVLKGAVTYALSCSSGKTLGVQAVAHGADAYIGYREEFIFLFDEAMRTRPGQDELAAHFSTSSNQVALSLLKGHTAKEAHENSRQSFARSMRKLLTSEATDRESAAIRYLFWNMRHQVCLGNGSAKI
ncbi:TPA: hypothetical protein DDZ10_03370 [Candidatus Uhrbacteria bacterium]|nr:hypothetical protein [Candidatus Uhrbacteria bacterium]